MQQCTSPCKEFIPHYTYRYRLWGPKPTTRSYPNNYVARDRVANPQCPQEDTLTSKHHDRTGSDKQEEEFPFLKNTIRGREKGGEPLARGAAGSGSGATCTF